MEKEKWRELKYAEGRVGWVEVRKMVYPRSTAPTYPPRSDGEAISDTTPYPMAIVAYTQISTISRP